ncbi:bicupin oxalate decarboxylase/oxidase [Phanerochaete sordida]|uniref:Bicupin oxalate decarboxylase/oxidase n=1 Tax=Phanerochaete sordida TaxID=48140 RepID=A0A9P3G820_9APHY|nr:bicupin oxalate decarboxylase/oxidase [Phanerochaete sordida]
MRAAWSRLLVVAFAAQLAASSPFIEAGIDASVPAPYAMPHAPLARRTTLGRSPRHLRPEDVVAAFPDDGPRIGKRDGVSPPDVGQMATFTGSDPEPTRLGTGFKFLANSNHALDRQNVDNVAPPTTDQGDIVNLKWSMSLSHTRLLKGGWVREQTVTDLPPSKDFAAAEIAMAPFAYRELHWHKVAEWGYVLGGNGRLTAIDEDGKSFISDIRGPTNSSDPDIYYFPPGVPHSIQALEEGLELLLVFPDGDFDALGTTFMLSDWFARTPLEIVAKNLGLNSTAVLGRIPQVDPYILPSTKAPPPLGHADAEAVRSPQGSIAPSHYVFRLAQQNATVAPGGGGWLKVQDSVTNFPVSKDIASALVFVEPNGLREMHWHNNDEWLYIISGTARATAFAGSSSSRTFDFQPGDTAVFPASWGHYVENTSPTEPLIYLEMFKAPKFIDFSATQWLALTPPQIVADLLNISTEVVEGFMKVKPLIIS